MSTPVLIGLTAAGLVLLLCLCGGIAGTTVYLASQTTPSSPGPSQKPDGSTLHVVIFEASDDTGKIDYVDYYSDRGPERNESVASPWGTRQTIDSRTINYITLSVHGTAGQSEAVTCGITVDGVQVDTGEDADNAICSANLN